MTEDEDNCPLYVTLRVSDREIMEHIIGLYKQADSEVEVISISNPCLDGSQPAMLDLGSITRRQWEALEVAHSYGHYTGKRGGDLELIADDLGISKSAASQRLRAAESRIVSGILGTGELSCSRSPDFEAEIVTQDDEAATD